MLNIGAAIRIRPCTGRDGQPCRLPVKYPYSVSPGHTLDGFKQVTEELHLPRFCRRISGIFFKLLCEHKPRTAKRVRCVPNGGFGDHDILTIFLTYPIHIVKKKVESSVPVWIVRHADTECNVEESVMQRMDIERVRTALKMLAPEERAIIQDFFFTESPIPVKELVEKYAMPKTSIYRKRDDALKKLKKILGNA